MRKFYDRSFRIGFLLTIVLSVGLNVVAWVNARNEYSKVAKENKILAIGGNYEWGFPYPSCCYKYYVSNEGKTDASLNLINIGTAVGSAFIVGLVFHGIGRKFREQINK